MYQYPYGNAQQLNLDWILNKLKELESGAGGGGVNLEAVSNALIALTYAEQNYNLSDIVFHDGKLYSANQNITAEPWNAAHWNEVLLANPVSNLVRYVSALNNTQVFNNSNVPGTHTSDALNNLASDISDLNDAVNPSKIVLISDSYGEDATAGGKSWETVVQETLTNKTTVKYTRGSGAFGYQDHTNVRYFPKYINDNVVADNAVVMVLMLCGANDGNLVADGNTTQAYIQNGIAEAKTALLAKFPNASKIAIGFCGNTSTQAKKRSYHIARMAYESGCTDNGLIFAYNFHHVLSNPSLINTSDYVHPTLAGSKLLGEAAIDYILGGSIDPFDYYALPVISTTLTPTYPEDGSITNNTCVKIGNTVSISARQTSLAKTGSYFIPFTIPEGFRPMANILCPMILQLDSGNSFKIANARVLTNGNIDVQPLTNLTINEWVFSISYATSEI